MNYKNFLKILIILVISLIVFLLLNPSYKINVADCENKSALRCNQTKEVDFMYWGEDNKEIKNNQITKEFLEDNCIELKKDVWACNKYLIFKN